MGTTEIPALQTFASAAREKIPECRRALDAQRKLVFVLMDLAQLDRDGRHAHTRSIVLRALDCIALDVSAVLDTVEQKDPNYVPF